MEARARSLAPKHTVTLERARPEDDDCDSRPTALGRLPYLPYISAISPVISPCISADSAGSAPDLSPTLAQTLTLALTLTLPLTLTLTLTLPLTL